MRARFAVCVSFAESGSSLGSGLGLSSGLGSGLGLGLNLVSLSMPMPMPVPMFGCVETDNWRRSKTNVMTGDVSENWFAPVSAHSPELDSYSELAGQLLGQSGIRQRAN